MTGTYNCSCGRLGGLYSTNGASLTFLHDGALLTNIVVGGVVTGAVSFAYDGDFRVKAIGVGSSNISYGYEADGLLTNAGAMALIRDDTSGFASGSALGFLIETQAFTGFGALETRIVLQATTSVYSLAHAYDLLGRVTQRVEGVLGSTNAYTYRYDASGRLHEVYTNGALRARYEYDANGNRTNALIEGLSAAATYNAQDQLVTYGSETFQYDAHGTLTNRSTGSTYRYDARGSLLEVRWGTNLIGYTVDPLGRRVAKTLNGTVVRRLLYQSVLRPAAELAADGTVISRFVYATRVNVPDYMVKTGRTFRIVTDHLGSVRLVVDASTGDVAQRMDYDEWGNVLQDTNPGFQPFGFAGGLYDPDTGLVRFGFRDYDPALGRWLAKDPILFGGGTANLFLYCNADPVNESDQTGTVGGAIIGPILVAPVAAATVFCAGFSIYEWWMLNYGPAYAMTIGNMIFVGDNFSDLSPVAQGVILLHEAVHLQQPLGSQGGAAAEAPAYAAQLALALELIKQYAPDSKEYKDLEGLIRDAEAWFTENHISPSSIGNIAGHSCQIPPPPAPEPDPVK